MAHGLVRLGAAQLGPAGEDAAGTLSRVCDLIGQAGREGIVLLAFPELSLSPYFPATLDPADEYFLSADSAPIGRVRRAAVDNDLAVILPFAERDGGQRYNSCILIDETGSIRGRYRKLHVPPGFVTPDGCLSTHERVYFRPGNDQLEPVVLGDLTVGMEICYDRMFPEVSRALALRGATVLTIPSANRSYGASWSVDAWEVLIRARAYENGCFVIAPSKAGRERGQPYLGDSLIASPIGGQVIARATTDGDELVCADVDLEDVHRARGRLDYQRDRRPEFYRSVLQVGGSQGA